MYLSNSGEKKDLLGYQQELGEHEHLSVRVWCVCVCVQEGGGVTEGGTK